MRPVRPTWDELWMDVARTVALRSLCDRDQVGAVIVSSTNRIIDTGYNGPPAEFKRDDTTCREWCPRSWLTEDEAPEVDYSDCPSLHAEANALMFSDRRLRDGGTIYVSSGTCSGCAKLVANSGLARAVYSPSQRNDGAVHRNSEQWYDFLRDCGLRVDVV